MFDDLDLTTDIIAIDNGLFEFFLFLNLLFLELFSSFFHISQGFGDDISIIIRELTLHFLVGIDLLVGVIIGDRGIVV
jgi:hypothetical protein